MPDNNFALPAVRNRKPLQHERTSQISRPGGNMRDPYRYSQLVALSWLMILIFTAMTLFATGCQTGTTPVANMTSLADQEALKLSIGVMPAVDSAPIFLADEEGLFTELGLDVDVQIYTNAMNRQSALQSGGLDGAMTDVIALINNVDNGFAIKVTTSTDGVFPILMKEPISGKTKLKAGVMEVSVTNYVTDRLLGGQYTLDKIYINEIPARLELVGKGELDIAVVPEPLASQGELNGLIKVLLPSQDAYSPEVMVFTDQAIREKREAIRLFHQAYNAAVDRIDADQSLARTVLVNTLKLNPEIMPRILLPDYQRARVPDQAYLQSIMDWNEKVLNKKTSLTYDELVDPSFIGHD